MRVLGSAPQPVLCIKSVVVGWPRRRVYTTILYYRYPCMWVCVYVRVYLESVLCIYIQHIMCVCVSMTQPLRSRFFKQLAPDHHGVATRLDP